MCEQLYQTFLRAPQGEATDIAASTLLARLDDKRRERWSEAVNTINSIHTSRLAWNILKKLTRRSRTSRRSCPISANCIASQLVKNRVYRTKDHEPARLVAKEVSELWKIETPAGESISHDFTPEEFSSALQLLKTGKVLGPDSISPELILGAVFVDLTAAYDIVWHRGLTCKLLALLPDRHVVSFIMELVRNRSFTLTTGNGSQSRLRRLRNGVPQGSVLATLLFNISTYDLPTTVSKKFAYADDLAILHSTGDWQTLEGTLTQHMKTLSSYLQKWKLKLSVNKTVTAAFHLYNREARRELTINVEGRALPFSTTPT